MTNNLLFSKQEFDMLEVMGQLKQMKDDYIDCFGDFYEFGKSGSDIETGKCTYLSANFNEVLIDKTIYLDNYGNFDQLTVCLIKYYYDLYDIKHLCQNSFKTLNKIVGF